MSTVTMTVRGTREYLRAARLAARFDIEFPTGRVGQHACVVYAAGEDPKEDMAVWRTAGGAIVIRGKDPTP